MTGLVGFVPGDAQVFSVGIARLLDAAVQVVVADQSAQEQSSYLGVQSLKASALPVRIRQS